MVDCHLLFFLILSSTAVDLRPAVGDVELSSDRGIDVPNSLLISFSEIPSLSASAA